MKIAVDILLALAGTVLFPRLICSEKAGGSGGLILLAVFAALMVLMRCSHWRKAGWRLLLVSHLAGALFSCLTAFGFSLEKLGYVPYGAWQLWLAVGVYTHVYGQCLALLFSFLEHREPALSKPGSGGRLAAAADWVLRKPWLVGALIFLLWLPCYLSTFPGNFVYDATKEFGQLETGYLGDFPMLHSVLITRLLSWSFRATGGYTLGIAVFTLGQMLLLAGMFTHMICRFRALGGNRLLLGALALYCAAFPAVHLLVTSTVRDVLFSGLLTYSVFLLWLMCRDVKAFLGTWWKSLGPALVLVLTIFSRNNNTGSLLGILLAAVCLLVFLVGGKKGWKGALSFCAMALSGYFLLGGVLTAVCQPMSPSSQKASMTVFTQTLARAYTLESHKWSEDDRQRTESFFRNKLRYVPENGDATKGRLQLKSQEDKIRFLEQWRKVGLAYPHHYADAVLANTRGMWFPGTVLDGYQENGVKLYEPYEKCYFYFADEIEEPGELRSLLPGVHKWYQNIALRISFEKIPVISLLFSVAGQFWLLLVCCFYALYRKSRHLYLPLAGLVAYAVISAFVPLILLRYFGALFFALPMVVVFLVQPRLGTRETVS